MEANRYDREQLLKEAMRQEGVKMPYLMQGLGMSEQEIFSGLYGEGAPAHIGKICRLLLMDPCYFSGGMRYENGRLVSK